MVEEKISPVVSEAQPDQENHETASENPPAGDVTCVECGKDFQFTAEQRQEFAQRGFQPPKRCTECRMKRRKLKVEKTSGRGPSSSRRPKPAARTFAPRSTPEPMPESDDQDNISYVAQAESLKSNRDFEGNTVLPSENVDENDDNFGNSIHYQGPGVSTRGSARDDSPQYAPWEGAHGFLLTHHERMQKSKEDSAKNRSPGAKSGNGKNFSNRNRARPRDQEKRRRPSFEIICATCGITTQVPFKPIPGKAVFCQKCYKSSRNEAKEIKSAAGISDESNSPPQEPSQEIPDSES